MDSMHYRAVYHLTGGKTQEGALTSDLPKLQELARGIAARWRGVVGATIITYPQRSPVASYTKTRETSYTH